MVSDEELLKEIQQLAEDGIPPQKREMNEDGNWSARTVIRHFGSWNRAVQAAGFDVRTVGKVNKEALLKEMHRLATNGKPPTSDKMRKDGRFDPQSFHRHFGSYNNAVQAAGFDVNVAYEYSEKQLLQTIREHHDNNRAPTPTEYEENSGGYSSTVVQKFGSWWKGVVRAGVIPRKRFPLSTGQFPRFHQATIDRNRPRVALAGLFLLFTGLIPEVISKIKPSWFDHLTDDQYGTLITVPSHHLRSTAPGEWTLKLPSTYSIGGTTRETQLPELAKWFFTRSPFPSQFPRPKSIETVPHRIGRDIDISRRSVERSKIGVCPDVKAGDLRASAGVQMARASAPRRRIRRHLGIEHTRWDADVEDFFLWLYVHEGTVHPDYDPPDVVLDPVSP